MSGKLFPGCHGRVRRSRTADCSRGVLTGPAGSQTVGAACCSNGKIPRRLIPIHLLVQRLGRPAENCEENFHNCARSGLGLVRVTWTLSGPQGFQRHLSAPVAVASHGETRTQADPRSPIQADRRILVTGTVTASRPTGEYGLRKDTVGEKSRIQTNVA